MRAVFLESLPYKSAFRVGGHHYADAFLADGWEAFWASHPLSPLHYLHGEKRDFEVRHEAWRRGPISHGGLQYYSPMTLLPTVDRPLLRSAFFADNSARATIPRLSGVVRRAGFARPDLVWLTDPIYLPIVRDIAPRAFAVRIADDNAAFRDIPPAFAALERRAIAEADRVFVVARGLYERIAAQRDGVVHLPNGVDVEHFSTPAPEPADLAAIPGPRVVYVGATEYWFDAELVAEAARALPEASFVLVGPVSGDAAWLGGLSNVHLLGRRGYEEVPAYLQHCDVGIIPFRDLPLVHSIHPIKLYEYLAAGLPVVSIRWTELEDIGAPAVLTDRGSFVDGLRTALERSADGREERLAFARANSWQARYETLRASLAEVLGQ